MDDPSKEKDPENSLDKVKGFIGNYIEESLVYLRVTRAPEILRRYFAMNAFDGAMTSMGVVMGSYIAGIIDPRSVIGIIIVSGIGMAVSGFSGTYMTESAERHHALGDLEEAMLCDLEETVYGKACKVVPIFAAIVDGSAPFLASIPSFIPFILASRNLMPLDSAYYTSLTFCLFTLFLLGVYLGRLSRKNWIVSGAKMVLAGVVVSVIALMLNGH
ncbi:MAG: hypothetical protein ACLFVP_05230 [Candidatus Bathyarchaeia archaeon]